MIVALRGKVKADSSADQYFLSSRNLPWYSIALSTIATNIQGYQFLGMMGSAYLFGLAQANLEINAVQGILIGAFIFVPFYLKEKVFTITEFIEKRLGKKIALFYSMANISLFSTITLGAALFWGVYATEVVFDDLFEPFVRNKFERITYLILVLGLISGFYTYLGGLNAVVKTDIIQFIIIIVGGLTRLTDSGLSITEWELFKGILPPFTNTQWEFYFNLYKEIPEYKLQNFDMNLNEFKIIFWWEWAHRFLGRLIGLSFLCPLIYFSIKKGIYKTKELIFILLFQYPKRKFGIPGATPASTTAVTFFSLAN